MSFGQFPNQQNVIQLLQRSLSKGRLAHGYLFAGGDLDEMAGVARTLAKALSCENPPVRAANGHSLDCCDQCLTCRKIDNEIHPDVQWLRPESKIRIITIDQVRELMQTINLKPNEARYKVAVINAADRLNPQAANAFLKTLEEPPARSILILTTTEPGRVLETILSRCLRLQFASEASVRLEADETDWLKNFTTLAAESKAGLLSRYKLLGHIVARLGGLKEATEKELSARSPLERYDDVDPKLREKWEVELTAAIEAEYRRKRTRVVLLAEWWLRDIWLLANELTGEMLALPDFEQNTRIVASRLSGDKAADNLRTIEHLQRLLNTNVQEGLAIEVSLLKLNL